MAVDPNLVAVAVVMHSSRVSVAAETVVVVFAAADANRAVKREVETVAMAGSSSVVERAVAASSVVGEVEAALAAGIVVAAVASVAAVPSPVVVVEIA